MNKWTNRSISHPPAVVTEAGGVSDDFGYNVAEDPVHVHDPHATIPHLLGIDHERLTYRYQGRDFRLTDVHGRVLTDIVA